jgi:hypothetical protein
MNSWRFLALDGITNRWNVVAEQAMVKGHDVGDTNSTRSEAKVREILAQFKASL